nr:DMT family transporter [Clostridium cavendishii]
MYNFKKYLILIIAVFAVSSSAIFVKLAQAPSIIIAFYRLFFTTLIFLPFLILNKKYIKELKELSKKNWIASILSGIILSIHYYLWFESLNYTSIGSSTVIVTLQPLFAVLGGFIFFKENFNRKSIIGCFIAVLGSIIVGFNDFQAGGIALYGDLLAFIAAGIITVYFFISQSIRKDLSLIPYSVISYLSSSIFLGIISYQSKKAFLGYSLNTWLALLGLSIFATILGQSIFNWLLKWLSTSIISMSILGEPIGTLFLAFIIFNETITSRQGIGILLILCGLSSFLLGKSNFKIKKTYTRINSE